MMRFSRHSGNPNIGVFAAVNESLAFTSADASPEFVRALEEALGVKTIKTTVAGAHVIGSLMALNSNCAVVSGLADSREVEVIEEHIPCFLLDDSLNAAGNNILVNDHGAIISPEYGHAMDLFMHGPSTSSAFIPVKRLYSEAVLPGLISDPNLWYYLSPSEVFARTYEIYVTIRSGPSCILRDISESKVHPRSEELDRAIAEFFDGLFRNRRRTWPSLLEADLSLKS